MHEAAETFLREHAEEFKIDADLRGLRVQFKREGLTSSAFFFQRLYQGYPVFRDGLVIGVNKEEGDRYFVTNVENNRVAIPTDFVVSPRLSANEARELAGSRFSEGVGAKIAFAKESVTKRQPETEFGVLLLNGRPHAVWRVELISNETPRGDWAVTLDDADGKILGAEDLVER
jgi:Zn-dependent metalloprotease